MSTNQGFLVEKQLCYDLNEKRYCELGEKHKKLIKDLFGIVDENEIISCLRTEESVKPDILITYLGHVRNVSIKSGTSCYIHQESIQNFIQFIRSLGFSVSTQKTILYYQFGDGTLNGQGKARFSYEKLRELLDPHIAKANLEMNKDKDKIIKIAERVIFSGKDDNFIKADSIVYVRDNEDFVVVCKEQIIKHIIKRNWNIYDGLHIGPFFIRPHARYIGKEIKDPDAINTVDIHWPHLSDDLVYISKKYAPYFYNNKELQL